MKSPVKYQPKKSTKPVPKEPKKFETSRIPVSSNLSPTSALGKLTTPMDDAEQSKPPKSFVPSRLESTIKSAGETSRTSTNGNSRNTPNDRKLSSEDSVPSDRLDVNNIVINDQPLIKYSDTLRVITTASRGIFHPYRRIPSLMFDGTSSEESTRSVSQDNDKLFYGKTFSGFQTKPSAGIEHETTFTLNETPKFNCFPVLINPDASSDLGNVKELNTKATCSKPIGKRWPTSFNLDKWKTWKTLYAVSISSLLVHLILYSDEYLLIFPIYFPYGWRYSDAL